MSEIFVSVIMPIYNGEKYLVQAIESVLNQSYKNVEILLISDGSTDKSYQICETYAQKYDNVFAYDKQNEGVGPTRNLGIEKAQGLYLAFLDCDDMWADGFLDGKLVDDIKNAGYADVIGFSHFWCNQDLSRGFENLVQDKMVIGGGIEAVNSTWQHHSSMFFKREHCIKHGLMYRKIRRHEDEIFRYQNLYLSNSIQFINKIMLLYRGNPNSETHNHISPETVYMPLLNAWYDILKWHTEWHAKDIEIINHSKGIICVYGIEGIGAMYKYGIPKKIVERIIQNNSCFGILSEAEECVYAANIRKTIREYFLKNNKFVIKSRVQGFGEKVARKLKKLPLICNVYEKKKFPIKTDKYWTTR